MPRTALLANAPARKCFQTTGFELSLYTLGMLEAISRLWKTLFAPVGQIVARTACATAVEQLGGAGLLRRRRYTT